MISHENPVNVKNIAVHFNSTILPRVLTVKYARTVSVKTVRLPSFVKAPESIVDAKAV
jgi:hypothetical protein